MRSVPILAALAVSLALPLAAPAVDIRSERVTFRYRVLDGTFLGSVRGREVVDHLLVVKAGRTLTLDLVADNPAVHFHLLGPGDAPELIYDSTQGGRSFEGEVGPGGDYRVRVFLTREAAGRVETAPYGIAVTRSRGAPELLTGG